MRRRSLSNFILLSKSFNIFSSYLCSIQLLFPKLEFHVKWLNYDESHNTWEPYAALRDTAQLHEYLRLHKLEKLIPQKFKI